MADLTVSTTVDTFMQAADALAARTAIGAAAIGDIGYGAVANFAALPSAAANSGKTYFVSAAQGFFWINRKPAGLYTSDGAAWNYDADQTDAYLAGLTPTAGQLPVGDGTNFVTKSMSGDATMAASGALTLATVNSNVGTFGSTTKASVVTVNAKGLVTAASESTVTPAVGSITGFGTGVATFLATPSSANLAVALTDETGSGAAVFATSPSLVTPILGTPTSGNLSNCTADGTSSVGFRNIPQNSQSADYTTVLADGGKHVYHPSADTTARTWTIDSNANVAYPVGTAMTFVNDTSGGIITIGITSDTLILAGTGSTGSRTLAANGIATAIKMTSTRWQINGTGLT